MARWYLTALIMGLLLSVDADLDEESAAARTEARKLLDAGKVYPARAKLKAAIAAQRERQTKPTQVVADLLMDLSEAYSYLKQEAEAIAALEEATDLSAMLHGRGDSRYGLAKDKLADAHMRAGEHTKAHALYEELLDAMRRGLGKSHPGYQFTLSKAAQAASAAGKHRKAADAFGELLESTDASAMETLEAVQNAAGARVQYSVALAKAGQLEAALEQASLAERAYAGSAAAGGLEHAASINGVAGVLERLGRDGEATAAMRRAYDLVEALDESEPDKAERLRQAKSNLQGLEAHVRRKQKKRQKQQGVKHQVPPKNEL